MTMPPVTDTREAKRIIRARLDELGFEGSFKLTARTIDFTDLARGSCIFVQIHGWKPDPRWTALRMTAVTFGFSVEDKP